MIARDFRSLIPGTFLPLLLLLSLSLIHACVGYSAMPTYGNAWGFDDAYISYRYARNLAGGEGLVFNSGERVEGYSNFLLVLLLTPAFLALGESRIHGFTIALNLMLMGAALLVFRRHVERAAGGVAATAAAYLLALTPPFWIAAGSGMETSLVLLLKVGIWTTVERLVEGERKRMLALCALLPLMILARADGFLFPAVAVLYLLLRGRTREAGLAAAAAAAAIAVYFSWRYAYYGHLLPNTYYVKVDGPLLPRVLQGAFQFVASFARHGLAAYPVAFAFTLFGLGAMAWRAGLRSLRQVPFDILGALLWIAYWLYIGGDALGERFLLILIMFWIYAFVRLVAPLAAPKAVVLLVVLLAVTHAGTLRMDPRFDYDLKKYDAWLTLGGFLGKEYPGAYLAIDSAGKAPFASGLRTLDMLGLNDPHIARLPAEEFVFAGHNKHDADYVLSRSPDLIAAWIVSDDMDLHWGLTREKYEAAGYVLRYLLRVKFAAWADPVLDISTIDEDDLIMTRRRGYDYGVLVREGMRPASDNG